MLSSSGFLELNDSLRFCRCAFHVDLNADRHWTQAQTCNSALLPQTFSFHFPLLWITQEAQYSWSLSLTECGGASWILHDCFKKQHLEHQLFTSVTQHDFWCLQSSEQTHSSPFLIAKVRQKWDVCILQHFWQEWGVEVEADFAQNESNSIALSFPRVLFSFKVKSKHELEHNTYLVLLGDTWNLMFWLLQSVSFYHVDKFLVEHL